MKLIIGLGNADDKYKLARHNIGHIFIDKIFQELDLKPQISSKLLAVFDKGNNVIYAKNDTFMNNSGDAVLKLSKFYKIIPEDITVIHDDMDLELGIMKEQFNIGAAGHHGVEDIISKLGTKSFNRVRIGIGRPFGNLPPEDFVLRDFDQKELRKILENVTIEALIG